MTTNVTTIEDILADVIVFLKDTLASEELTSNANIRRQALLHRILSKEYATLSYMDMNGCQRFGTDVESANECYEELESSWSSSAASSNTSRTYSNTLPVTNRLQRFSFIFGNSLVCDSKNRDFLKTNSDTADYPNDVSKRNSALSDSDNSLSPSSIKSEDSSEIMSISASAIRYSAIKCGTLIRKDKTLFFEHSKRLWVALLGTTLFVYNSEKDTKPMQSINVDEYKARPIAPVQINKKEFGFEIVCPAKKTFQFFTSSKSEMETWILSINHSMPLPQTSSVLSAMCQVSNATTNGDDQVDSKQITDNCNSNSITDGHRRCDNRRESCRYECLDNPADRQLPSIPYLYYDTPNPMCRAVTNDYRETDSHHFFNNFKDGEALYHSIDDESLTEQLAQYDFPLRRDSERKIDEYQTKNQTLPIYYNISNKIEDEETRDGDRSTIKENTKNNSAHITENKENLRHKKCYNSRIKQIIQKMEEINNHQNNSYVRKIDNNSLAKDSKLVIDSSESSPVSEQIYELVTLPTYVNIR